VDAAEALAREFCFGGGRALPLSIFLGRVMPDGQPEWLPEDRLAALEWVVHQRSLCPGGCGQPRSESFAEGNDDLYDVTLIQCHACAARDRRLWSMSGGDPQAAPPFGICTIVTPEVADAVVDVAG
jgi:hypothetical protein